MTRRIRAAALPALCAAGVTLAGCGEEDFANDPRPPVTKELTGVITDRKVTVSPNELGAGPVVITVSNQTEAAHTITLESTGGGSIREQVGPINPLDTAELQRTLEPGEYTVSAGSEAAVPREISPATLTIGPERESASDELLLP
ncbi:MAG TPA: hypothetical protein VD790_06470 [Thermoleophilaceae bacterium]|nr:hypothetical protein [Thermoleophilaceae bacterium]